MSLNKELFDPNEKSYITRRYVAPFAAVYSKLLLGHISIKFTINLGGRCCCFFCRFISSCLDWVGDLTVFPVMDSKC